MKRINFIVAAVAALLIGSVAAFAERPLNSAVNDKIRKEAFENSQIMETIHHFTDVYGPRLTGSPKLVKAGEWSMARMKSWGFDRTEMEPWDWGSVGWENDRASGHIISPVKDSLVFEVLAWTPSTNGAVKGDVVRIDMPRMSFGQDPRCVRNPTRAELDAFFATLDVRNKIVMVGQPADLKVDFDPPSKRFDAEALSRRLDGAPRQVRDRPDCPSLDVTPLGFRELFAAFSKFMKDNGVLVQINDARMRHGTIRAFGNRSYDPNTSVPTVVMRNEDYGRIWRIVSNGTPVELEFDIRNSIYPEGRTAYNTIGEITGTDKADEVVMLGGHLDAWHSATGATDNAVGCAVTMEAARILKAIGVKPRRTIRVALWSGEEQGLRGSRAYVEKHFGTFENPKPAYYKFGGYVNVDTGTGRIRAMTVFGPPETASILNQATLSYYDLDFVGVRNTPSRRLGGSDHTSFNQAGLPGIGTLLDPIEYFTHTWHTNLDTYERIVEDDVKASAALVASTVYELAMRDELLPRFAAKDMPSAPGRRR